jgi:hypothetical protein
MTVRAKAQTDPLPRVAGRGRRSILASPGRLLDIYGDPLGIPIARYQGITAWQSALHVPPPSHCSPYCNWTRPSPQKGAQLQSDVHTPGP